MSPSSFFRLVIMTWFVATVAFADVKVPAIISDHMVLLRSEHTAIWGTAVEGEEITISLDKYTAKAIAGADGKWKATLDLRDAGPGPFTMKVEGKNTLTISDVVVGEVWFASGQSNMKFMLQSSADSAAEIGLPENPLLREFRTRPNTSPQPTDYYKGRWSVASPQTRGNFSAVAYYFAKTLQKEIGMPVGIIMSAVGGTPVEAWSSAESLDKNPDVKIQTDAVIKYAGDYPALIGAYNKEFQEWLKKNGREDHPATNVQGYASDPFPAAGWIPIPLPGPLKATALPNNGVIWIRRDVDIPAEMANKELKFSIGIADGCENVYWNGKWVGGVTPENQAGARTFRIPANLIKEGKATIAVRLFVPGYPVKFIAIPVAGALNLSGEWLACAEFAQPDLSKEQLADMPKMPDRPIDPVCLPMHLFNGMVNPFLPYAIRGIIWYQGEQNVSAAYDYRKTFTFLIEDWQKKWAGNAVPFYFCQLPNFRGKNRMPADNEWSVMRESQATALSLPKTGMVVTIDLGEARNIHPLRKKEVGERLALIALANDYGKKIPFSGPVYDSIKFEKGMARVKFRNVENGLIAKPLPDTYPVQLSAGRNEPLERNSPNSAIEGFAICGPDQKWVWADACIEGDSVLVWSAEVPDPVAIRYAWAANPTCNLYNSAGLPAAPFRTDDFSVTPLPVAKYK